MPVTYTGIRTTEDMITRLDTTAKKRVKSALIEKANEIRDLAVKMAPRDESNLEQAIKVRGEAGVLRDEAGRFARAEIEIYIDGSMPVPQRPGKTVGDYAYEIHTHLEPAGPWRLGEESRAKQQGQSETVGGGFMDRAAAAVDGAIDAALLRALQELI